MDVKRAIATVLQQLRQQKKLTNSRILQLIGGDESLLREVRESLIMNDLAKDKGNVGLSFAGQQGDSEGKVRLFLSYGRRDAKDLADRLYVDLTAAGYDVWQDRCEIRAGRSWERQIEDGLRSAQIVVALLSPHAVRKSNDLNSPDNLDSVCLDEISFARFAKPPIPIVPAMAVPCEPPFCIFRLDYVDLTSWKQTDEQYDAGFRHLLEGIEAARRNETRHRTWMHRIRPLDVFDAFLHEKRKDFVGRQWLFDEIDAWRFAGREQALLITGDPGAGKSAIVSQFVHLNPGGQVLAYHCCIADTPETLRPSRFVQSLAAMIGSRLPGYAKLLETVELQDKLSDARCNQDPASAFESGILAPLDRLRAPSEGVRLILIDGLDESLVQIAQGPTIVDLLASRLHRLPGWLRIVATTRNEPGVLRKLSTLRAEKLDASDSRNTEDIDDFVEARLHSPNLSQRVVSARASFAEVQRKLREVCRGNFLYVKQALIDLERDNYQIDQLDSLPQGLIGLYEAFFARIFGREPSHEAYGPTRQVLEVVVASQKPLDEEQIALATGLDPDYELAVVLRRLASFLSRRDGRLALYHRSLADWLIQRDNPFHASPRKGHEQLAKMCLVEYHRGVKTMSPYALSSIAIHLIGAKSREEAETVLTDLIYVQAACEAGLTFDLLKIYAAMIDTFPDMAKEWKSEEERLDELAKYSAKLIRYAKKSGRSVPFPSAPSTLAVRSMMEKSDRDSSNIEIDTNTFSRLQQFSTFVSSQSHNLDRFPEQTLPIAFNHASSGEVTIQAKELLDFASATWLRREPRPSLSAGRPHCARTLLGRDGIMYSVAIASDSTTAVSGSDDGAIRVWEVNSGKQVHTLVHEPKNARTAVALTADGALAVSGNVHGELRVWDISNGRLLSTLEGNRVSTLAIAVTPDGRTAVSGGSDGKVYCWDVSASRLTQTLDYHNHWIWDVDLSADGTIAVSASQDETVCIWDLVHGKILHTLDAHTAAVTSVALTPDGRTLISGSDDQSLYVWEVPTGRSKMVLQEYQTMIKSAAITHDGNMMVVGGFDGTIRVWDLSDGNLLQSLHGHSRAVHGLALSSDGRTCISASSDGTIRVWDLAHGRGIQELQGHPKISALALAKECDTVISGGNGGTLSHWKLSTGRQIGRFEFTTESVTTTALTSDGNTAVSSTVDENLRVWEMEHYGVTRVLEGHNAPSTAVAISPDGTRAVSLGADKSLCVWDVRLRRLLRTIEAEKDVCNFVAISSDGILSVIGNKHGQLRIWDLPSGQLRRTLDGRGNSFENAFFAADDRLVAAVDDNDLLHVWDLQSGRLKTTVEELSKVNLSRLQSDAVFNEIVADANATVDNFSVRELVKDWWMQKHRQETDHGWLMKTMSSLRQYVSLLAVSPDGRYAISNSLPQTLYVWDLTRGRLLRTLEGHTARVRAIAITAEGKTISTGDDNAIRIWDTSDGTLISRIDVHSESITSIAVAFDGKTVFCGGECETLQVWDLTKERLARSWPCGPISAIAVSKDGSRIVSGSKDGQVRVWDNASGRQILSFESPSGSVTAIGLISDDTSIFYAGDDNVIRVWDMQKRKNVATYPTTHEIVALACDADCRIVVGEDNGQLHFLTYVSQLFNGASRNG